MLVIGEFLHESVMVSLLQLTLTMLKDEESKPLTLLQSWAADRVKGLPTKQSGREQTITTPLTKKQRKLTHILEVHDIKVRKVKYPKCCYVRPSGELPTAHFVQGGRPESKRRG